jgi:hypothetical protein
MEYFENKNTHNNQTEISDTELNNLVIRSYSRALQIFRKEEPQDSKAVVAVPVTTPEAYEKDKYGILNVTNGVSEITIQLTEVSDVDTKLSTTELFHIWFSPETRHFELEVTGPKPDVVENLLYRDDMSDDEYAIQKEAAEADLKQQFRDPTAAEVKRLYELLELGLYGDDRFDHDRFKAQYYDYLDDLDSIKKVADKIRDHIDKQPE